MIPRTLRDVTGRDASIELFGRKLSMPLIVGPTLYGAAAGGRALAIFKEKIGTAMAMLGVNSGAEFDRNCLR